jgi:O-Antigen ligase
METTFQRPNPMALASAAAAFSAGILTAFTVSIGGEMPLGEVILSAVFCWIAFYAVVTGSLPPEVPRARLFGVFMICQAVAFAAYVFSDLYRHSSLHDMGRGWARMAFLGIDVVAVAYLFGCSRMNLLVFLFGQLAGDVLHSLTFGALFDDMWKFGVGVPLTYLAFFLASLLGRLAFVVTAFAMTAVHLLLDYRSFGMACFIAGTATLITLFPRRLRAWLMIPAVVVVVAATAAYALGNLGGSHRTTRSNVERSSMLLAASEGFYSSPFIGQGSWFSNSNVMSNFMDIRSEKAKAAEVGGFPDPRNGIQEVAIHSQILVTLAEGGIFGASFFIAFGVALAVAIYQLTFTMECGRFTGIYILILFSALFNWLMSPFSGAHRVYIAVACGLLFLLQGTRAMRPAPT